MRGPNRAHRSVRKPGLVALALSCAVFGLTGCTRADGVATVPAASVTAPRGAPVVMILGDSFTVGSGPVERWQTYATETARKLGWQPVIAGAGGTGFVNRGKVGRDFTESYTAELAWRPAPDMLIISGGHNDRRPGADRVEAAAYRLLTSVRAHWPRTRVVVIGPMWMGRPPDWAYQVRDGVSEAAVRAKVAFLDALPERDAPSAEEEQQEGLLLPDGVHPTLQGHRQLANWLVTEMRKLPLAG